MNLSFRLVSLAGFFAAVSISNAAAEWKSVEALLAAKCYACHGGEKTKGEVDLKRLAADPLLAAEYEIWTKVKDSIEAGDMPPKKAKALTAEEQAAITGWVTQSLDALAEAKSGDPGPVTMRRLTNAEYDYTIRDLTGHEFGLAREFQTDGGGGEGFSNTGDVLFTSPAAVGKYFSAARALADHATVMPGTGIVFHAQRIGLRGPEQVKTQAQQGLYVWYQQKAAPHLPKDFDDKREADYMLACWRHRHQKVPLEQLAREGNLDGHFLANWWKHLNNTEPKSRFLDLTRVAWRALPADETVAHERIKAIQADLLSWNNPKKPGEGVQRHQQDSDGIQPYPMQAAVGGKKQAYLCFGDIGDGSKGDIALVTAIEVSVGAQKLNYFEWLNRTLEEKRRQAAASPAPVDLDAVRARIGELEKMRAAYGRHPLPGRKIASNTLAFAAPTVCALPLPEGAHWLKVDTRLDMENPEVEEATLQWTIATEKPRDVTQVMPGVLTVWKRGTPAAMRTMGEFISMEQAFPDMLERRLQIIAENIYRNSPGLGVYYFNDEQLGELLGAKEKNDLAQMRKDWSLVASPTLNKEQEAEYDGALLRHLREFARRAWRRPLGEDEGRKLEALYFDVRGQGRDRESAAREVIVRVLVSPNFLFKAETLPAMAAAGEDVRLSVHEVASRLSYFLWASQPDEELRRCAEDGSLLKPEVLDAQTLRMLRDVKAKALAKEFAGQWLKFSGFDEASTVDEKRYPEFTAEVRRDMQREVTEFFAHLVREDRSVGDILGGDYSFLNERLAKFYGVPGVTGEEFREVKVAQQQRGGLLGMGAVLTKTSRPNRTSPVLRGDYLYQVVLGFNSPPPPPNVPKLPDSAVKPASLREALMQHRADKACAVCHDRIDPLGFALEGFDPIGRFRKADEAGGKIDDTGVLKDGTQVQGLAGLRDYLKKNEGSFNAQFCRKLLGYALGRQTMLSDRALLLQMQAALRRNSGRFSAAVLEVVSSRPFLNRRNEAAVAGKP
ncbi:DUF1592 domain-containing protein [Prosthecobacter sp.]|uniref:DUF1592 domain-containing protein n=1 Tax=Prosthecobacter sp. TaxID=1965333 RepID=UPI002487E85F|nr:DUF1592 domain-containing protein [Prosthecobacter sp.]MDI1313259.1 DUF1592 domain-containing protein [Prosthecobacter sp.]